MRRAVDLEPKLKIDGGVLGIGESGGIAVGDAASGLRRRRFKGGGLNDRDLEAIVVSIEDLQNRSSRELSLNNC